jgi:predicted transcriptional regulator of viral defense system
MRSTERFFAQNPVFSLDAFARNVGAGESVDTAYRHLDYYVRSGRLRRLRSKLYAVVPPDTEADAFTPDPYLVASVAGQGAPLGYHTALELLGVGHSIFHTLTVVSDKWAKAFEFEGTRVEFVKVPAGLWAAGRVDLGVTSVRHSGQELAITGRERTLVDCLLRPGRAGGVEEVLNSLDGFGVVDIEALEEYLAVLDVGRAWALTGYYLEKRKDRLFIPDDVLERLAGHAPKTHQYWMRQQRGGSLVKRWNLIVPEQAEAILGRA